MLQTPEKKPDAIERSYQVLALLKVCEHCADYIEDRLGDDYVRHAAASLSNVLGLAHEPNCSLPQSPAQRRAFFADADLPLEVARQGFRVIIGSPNQRGLSCQLEQYS